jgi:hypothetical protein
MFKSNFCFLGYAAKKFVAGDVHAAQGSSPHRVSDGQRRTRQLPKAKTRLSGSSVQQFVPRDTVHLQRTPTRLQFSRTASG